MRQKGNINTNRRSLCGTLKPFQGCTPMMNASENPQKKAALNVEAAREIIAPDKTQTAPRSYRY